MSATSKTAVATCLTTILMGCGAATLVAKTGHTEEKDDPPAPTKLTDRQIVETYGPAVVRLTGENGYGEQSGSGVVIDAEKGLVLTNAHVVAGTTSLQASVNGKDAGPARIEGQAPCEDLAVVKLDVPPAGLKEARLGRSAGLATMQHVLALGFPTSPETEPSLSATAGSVSKPQIAVNDDGAVAGDLPEYRSVVQHDAVIRPGNSGGPLFNEYGEVIGINSLGDDGGQSWAITADHARAFVKELSAGKNRAYVGWSAMPIQQFLQTVEDPTPFAALSDVETGLIVTGVESNSPAAAAGFAPGDLVGSMNGQQADTVADVCQVAQSQKPGATVPVEAYALEQDDWGMPFWTEAPTALKFQ